LLVACSDDLTMSDKNPDKSRSKYPVVIDTASYAKLTSDERKRLEDDAIQRILDFLPSGQRQEAATILGREIPNVPDGQFRIRQFAGSSNPEIARLLSVITSIRAAEYAARPHAAMNSAPSQPQRPTGKTITITVAIDNSATKATAVIRADYPLPVLILPPNADQVTVKAGLRTVGQLYQDFGPRPTREYRAEVLPSDRDHSPRTTRLLSRIREEGAPKRIPGFGEGLLALEVVTDLK